MKTKSDRKEEMYMKKTKLEKVLWSVAKESCDSTSAVFLYEPKVPQKLVKKDKKKEQ